jgi:putative thiamine transport system permease protein
MNQKITLAGVLAALAVGVVFLPLLPGLALIASPLREGEIWLQVLQDGQFPLALQSTVVSALISVCGALALTVLIICGLWPGPRWQSYVRRLPLLLAFPHVAFASGLLFLFSANGWLSRLLHVAFPVDSASLGLGLMLAFKEAWFLLWFASTQLSRSELEQQLIVSRSMGYGPLHSRLLVIIPQLLPRLGWALVAVMTYSLSVVDVAIILGPDNPPTLAVLAWQWMNDGDPQRQAMGMALSALLVVLLAGSGTGGWLLWQGLRRRLGMFSGRRRQTDARLFSSALASGLTVIVMAAGAILLCWSLAESWFYPSLLPEAFSFSGWELARYDRLLTTLWLALASGPIAALSVLLWLEGIPRRFDVLLLLPLFLPALPLAAGQYQVLLRLAQEGTWPAVVWSHLLWVIPYALLVLRPAWQQLDPRHAIAARTLGRSGWQVLWTIKTPLLLRPLLGALAVGFSVSVAQYLPTLYAGAGRFATVTTEAVALSSGGDPQQMAIQALLQVLLPAGMFIFTLQAARLAGHYRQGLR